MVRTLIWVGSRSLSLVEIAVDVEDQVISPRVRLPIIEIIVRCDKTKRFKLAIWYYVSITLRLANGLRKACVLFEP